MEQNNAAIFAFFYMLSLVALVFMALSTGIIIFQIINKEIVDVINRFQGQYSPEALKFAISALIISAPIFYITARQIYKSLSEGRLDKDSGIRKWLTYFILFVASVVMLGWLIATINSFLGGELTTKFVLKSITSIGIAAAIFTFYLHDIRRSEVAGKKDNVIRIYFYASLAVVVAAFAAGLFYVETPTETRNRKIDNLVLDDFSSIDGAVNTYYRDNEGLPEDLEELESGFNFITDETLVHPESGREYEYRITGDRSYELCADFLTSNIDNTENRFDYYKGMWPHEAGYQCIGQRIHEQDGRGPVPLPAD